MDVNPIPRSMNPGKISTSPTNSRKGGRTKKDVAVQASLEDAATPNLSEMVAALEKS